MDIGVGTIRSDLDSKEMPLKIPDMELEGADEISKMAATSEDMDKALLGKTVKTTLIPEETDIKPPNYVIDLSGLQVVMGVQGDALTYLIDDGGDVRIYVMMPGKTHSIGYGKSEIIDDIILDSMKNIFGDKCRVFKDVKIGEPMKELKRLEAGMIRLKI